MDFTKKTKPSFIVENDSVKIICVDVTKTSVVAFLIYKNSFLHDLVINDYILRKCDNYIMFFFDALVSNKLPFMDLLGALYASQIDESLIEEDVSFCLGLCMDNKVFYDHKTNRKYVITKPKLKKYLQDFAFYCKLIDSVELSIESY